jgi:HAE1 family hydrophobic/amphiphilic exporter-1
MFLSDIAIKRPVFTAMLSLALIVFGILAFRRLAVDQFPPVDFPVMLVQTVYPGAAPEDIERDVTNPLEDAVASVAGLDQVQSFTRGNVSVIVLQFTMGADQNAVVNAVRDRVGLTRAKLPTGAEEPQIRQIEFGALPIMVVSLSTPAGVNVTRDLADERLKAFLEQVEGVGTVNVLGGQTREVHVDLDLDKLAALGISAQQVADRIGYDNLSVPIGEMDQQGFTVGIRSIGEFKSIVDLKSTVIHLTQLGRQVRLEEVAEVTDSFAKPDRMVRYNRQEAVTLEIIKRSGANTVEVAHNVRRVLADVVPTLAEGAVYDVISDSSEDIEANAHEVWIAIYFGGAMAVLVILFFLLDLRGTIISALALPTSVIGTFALMGLLGFSLNTMTLLGLSLAIGLLIDDAVVVREAITRRLEAGDSPMEAASRGTKEIALAVLATTLSLVAVFVPVAFMSGIVGQFFKQFGITIAAAVLLSLFVAFTLDPMLSSRFSKVHDAHAKRSLIPRMIERFLDGVDRGYTRLLAGVLRWRKTTVLFALASLAFTVVVGSRVPAEFVPMEDKGEFLADFRMPPGTSMDTTYAQTIRMESLVLGIPGVERVYSVVGIESAANRARLRVRTVPAKDRDVPLSFYEDKVRELLAMVPGAEATIQRPGMIEGLGDWAPLMLIIQGDDTARVLAEAARVTELVRKIPGTSDVRMSVNPGRPELRVELDRALASDRGTPAALIGGTARLLVDGAVAGSLRDGGKEGADIRVRAAPRFSSDVDAIKALPLPSPRGRVTLGDVAVVRMDAGQSEIQHFNRLKSVTVSTQVAPGGALGDIVTAAKEALAKDPLPPGYMYKIEGQAADMEETSAAMGLAVFTAMTFIYMVLASQFESLTHPFTLLVSVPLAMVGAVLALWITGSSFSMGSQIGLILLMGLVTKNAILLVDGALQHMRDGHGAEEAMMFAGPRRLRPILMTSAAMVFGMLPTAIGTGIGASFRAPMGIAVIGGVVSSTLLTLLVVPIVFLWVERGRALSARASAWAGGKRATTHAPAVGDDAAVQAAK